MPADLRDGADAPSPVGDYATGCAGAVDSNYTITYAWDVTVNPATLVVTASSPDRRLRCPTPAVSASYAARERRHGGLLSTQPTCSTTATPTSPVGPYPSSCSGRGRPELHHQLRRRHRPGRAGRGHGDRLVGLDDLRGSRRPSPPLLRLRRTVTRRLAHHPPTCSSAATAASPWAATPSCCTGAADPNYSFSYVNGSVTSTPPR